MKQRAIETAKIFSVILALGIVYYIFVRINGMGFPCPLYSLAGILCPCCGLSRATVALISLDFASAIYYNATSIVVLPTFIVIIITYYYRYIKYGEKKLQRWQKLALLICLAMLLVFGVVRNITEVGLHFSNNVKYN